MECVKDRASVFMSGCVCYKTSVSIFQKVKRLVNANVKCNATTIQSGANGSVASLLEVPSCWGRVGTSLRDMTEEEKLILNRESVSAYQPWHVVDTPASTKHVPNGRELLCSWLYNHFWYTNFMRFCKVSQVSLDFRAFVCLQAWFCEFTSVDFRCIEVETKVLSAWLFPWPTVFF